MNDLETLIAELKDKLAKIESEIEEWTKRADENPKELEYRAKIQDELSQIKNEKEDLLNQISKFQDYDPENFDVLKQQCTMSREAVERWTGLI